MRGAGAVLTDFLYTSPDHPEANHPRHFDDLRVYVQETGCVRTERAIVCGVPLLSVSFRLRNAARESSAIKIGARNP